MLTTLSTRAVSITRRGGRLAARGDTGATHVDDGDLGSHCDFCERFVGKEDVG